MYQKCSKIFQTSSPPQQYFWIHLSWHFVEQKTCPRIQTITAAKTNPTTKSVISHHSQSWRHPVQLLVLQEAVNYIWEITIISFLNVVRNYGLLYLWCQMIPSMSSSIAFSDFNRNCTVYEKRKYYFSQNANKLSHFFQRTVSNKTQQQT